MTERIEQISKAFETIWDHQAILFGYELERCAAGTTVYRCFCGWSSDFLTLLYLHQLSSQHEERKQA